MQKAKRFQIDIEDPFSLNAELAFNGLVVLEVYAKWCGVCKPIDGIFRNHSVELATRRLKFVRVCHENVPWCRRFHGHCRPVFLFLLNGQLKHIVVGLKTPVLDKLIPELTPEGEDEDSTQATDFAPEKYLTELTHDEAYRDFAEEVLTKVEAAKAQKAAALQAGLDVEVEPTKVYNEILSRYREHFAAPMPNPPMHLDVFATAENPHAVDDEVVAERNHQEELVAEDPAAAGDKPAADAPTPEEHDTDAEPLEGSGAPEGNEDAERAADAGEQQLEEIEQPGPTEPAESAESADGAQEERVPEAEENRAAGTARAEVTEVAHDGGSAEGADNAAPAEEEGREVGEASEAPAAGLEEAPEGVALDTPEVEPPAADAAPAEPAAVIEAGEAGEAERAEAPNEARPMEEHDSVAARAAEEPHARDSVEHRGSQEDARAQPEARPEAETETEEHSSPREGSTPEDVPAQNAPEQI